MLRLRTREGACRSVRGIRQQIRAAAPVYFLTPIATTAATISTQLTRACTGRAAERRYLFALHIINCPLSVGSYCQLLVNETALDSLPTLT